MPESSQRGLFADTEDEEAAVDNHDADRDRDDSCDPAAPPPSPPPASLKGQTVWAIDANSLIFQVFHAIPEMTGPKGEPVAAIFGFTRDILFILEQKKPDYLFVAFDRPEKTFRHDVLTSYKSQRKEMPVDLVPQFPAIHRVLAALGVPVLDCERYEADDILATIAHVTNALEGECFVVTADKDCRQLITDHVKVFNVRKNQVYDACALKEDWGIRPDQVVDFQALVGDSIDNIPGVPLIGPKIAGELLQKYDNLDNLLAHADELPKGKRKDNLIAHREQVLVSRELARLERETPVRLDWDAARIGGIDGRQLAALCVEFGFKSLAEKLAQLTVAQPGATWEFDYQTIDSAQKLGEFVALLRQQPRFAMEIQATHVWPRWADLVGIAFSWAEGIAYYLPLRAPEGEAVLDSAEALALLKPILEDPQIGKVGQNLKYATIVLRSSGVELAGAEFDVMIASYLLDAGERNHDLDELAQRYLNHTTIKLAQLTGSGKSQKRIDEVPVVQASEFADQNADIVWRLVPILKERLESEELDELFHSLEMPLLEVLADIETTGIRIDVPRLRELGQQYGALLIGLEQEIYRLAGRPFNIGSPKQLQQVLFDEQHLPMLKKTKTGGSTDVEVLEELALAHPLPAKIIEYRQYSKLKNTYIDALPQMVHAKTGRVHASFNQVVAATGRLSASDPNLQNIPIRNQRGREIRATFLPGDEGWSLLAADYSQIELRVLAHFCGDRELCAAFARDEDIHTRVAAQVYGVPASEVTPEMRRTAKAVNFGVIYGQSPFGLAKTINIDQAEAATFIDAYFTRFGGVEDFLNKILEGCRRDGYVKTILGRRRAIRGIRSGAGRQRNLPERTAINTVIQGSAADLIKLAMINVQRRLRRERLPAKMLLQIHDELVFEVPSDQVQPLARLVADEMAGAVKLSVPVKVDVKFGPNWAECEPWQ